MEAPVLQATIAEQLHSCVKILATLNTDWAQEENGVGFNKPDSFLGMRLATIQSSEWNDEMVYTAHQMLRKYAKQLATYGIDFHAIPTPPAPQKDTYAVRAAARQAARFKGIQRILKINDDGKLIVSWGLDQALLEEFKNTFAYEERHWDKDGKKGWYLFPGSAASVDKLIMFCDRWNITITEDALMRLYFVRNLYEKGEVEEIIPVPRVERPKLGRYIVPLQASREVKILFDYDPVVKDALAQTLPLRRFVSKDNGGPYWAASVTDAGCVDAVIAFAELYNFEFRDGAREYMDSIRDAAEAAIQASKALTSDFKVDGLLRNPYPFQLASVKYGVDFGSFINADDPGTGKTIQSIALAHYLNAYPILVICPATLKYNWRDEFEMTVPNLSIHVFEKTLDVNADVVIVNYDMVTKLKEQLKLRRWGMLICDEAHRIKNHASARTKTILELATKTNASNEKYVDRVMLLTGTPIQNRPQELITLLTAIGKLQSHFGGYQKFVWRYCNPSKKVIKGKTVTMLDGATNLDELYRQLRNGCMVRRLKREVLTELPAHTRTVIKIKIDNRAEYDKAEEDIVHYVAMIAAQDKAFLETIKDLPEEEQEAQKRAYASDKAQRAARAEILVKINHLRQIAAKGKLSAIEAWVKDFMESGEKLLIFGYYKSVVETFGEAFKADIIYGETENKKRAEMVKRFQNDSEMKLLVLNMQSGGEGITLTAASNVVFAELGWRPSDLIQAESRVERNGQKWPTTAWYFLDFDTIDSYLWNMVQSKQGVADAALDGGEVNNFEAQEKADVTGALDFANELMKKHKQQGEVIVI